MKSTIHVVLTETAVVVLARGAFMLSIPLSHWTTTDGTTSSGQLRRTHEIDWLMENLREALNRDGTDSIMRRIFGVMLQETPPPPYKKESQVDLDTGAGTKPAAKAPAIKPTEKIKRSSTRERYMPAVRRPHRRSIPPNSPPADHRDGIT